MKEISVTFDDLIPGMILYAAPGLLGAAYFLIIAVGHDSFTYIQLTGEPVIIRTRARNNALGRPVYPEFIHINLVIQPQNVSI